MMEAAYSSETLVTLCPGITSQKTIITMVTASVFVKT
jgi:hypothetical protein